MKHAARLGLAAMLLGLGGCADHPAEPPGPASQSEEQAIAEAAEMLEQRRYPEKPQSEGSNPP